MNNEGIITYPYSMREIVNIVSHLEKYPNEVGLRSATCVERQAHASFVMPAYTRPHDLLQLCLVVVCVRRGVSTRQSITDVVRNVFDFDSYDAATQETVRPHNAPPPFLSISLLRRVLCACGHAGRVRAITHGRSLTRRWCAVRLLVACLLTIAQLVEAFHKHGIPLGTSASRIQQATE